MGSNIMEWTEMLYLRCRGVYLGTFSGAILSSAFKEQSSKWASMTKAYVSRVIVVIHRFMVMALDKLTGKEIWKVERKTDARLENEHAYTSPVIVSTG